MAVSIRGLVPREPVELPEGVEKVLRFSGLVVRHLVSGEVLTVRGPVDLDAYGSIPLTFTSAVTGLETTVQGLTMLVREEDGRPVVDKPLNVVSKRLIQILAQDLANGDYLKVLYRITAVGAAPKTIYQIIRG